MNQSDLERKFQTLWLQCYGPELESEIKFHPKRRWRFDFGLSDIKVAIECEGGIWSKGRHTRGKGFENDCVKYNAATALGWRVFRVTTSMLDNDPYTCLSQIIGFIEDERHKKLKVD